MQKKRPSPSPRRRLKRGKEEFSPFVRAYFRCVSESVIGGKCPQSESRDVWSPVGLFRSASVRQRSCFCWKIHGQSLPKHPAGEGNEGKEFLGHSSADLFSPSLACRDAVELEKSSIFGGQPNSKSTTTREQEESLRRWTALIACEISKLLAAPSGGTHRNLLHSDNACLIGSNCHQ